MDQFGLRRRSLSLASILARRRFQDAARLAGAVIDEPARDFRAVGAAANYCFAALEFTRHFEDADRQQAFALVPQSFDRARVEHQLAANLQMIGEPLFARGQRLGRGFKQSSDALAARQAAPARFLRVLMR